jgi:hypothetical protein
MHIAIMLQGDLKRKNNFFFQITLIHFIHILTCNNITANTLKFNSKSIKLHKFVMFTKIAPQFHKVLYKWTPQEAKLLHGLKNLFQALLFSIHYYSYDLLHLFVQCIELASRNVTCHQGEQW